LPGGLNDRRRRRLLGRQDGLADSKGAEGEDLAHHDRNGSKDEDLGAEHDRTTGYGRQRGADRACAVLGAHHQHTEYPENELAEKDADQAPASRIADDLGGVHCPGAKNA
jgi:hypothetical protein